MKILNKKKTLMACVLITLVATLFLPNTSVQAAKGTKKVAYPVKIDKKHFPNSKFLETVKYHDLNNDGKLSKEEAESDTIYVSENKTYKGMEYFPVVCTGNKVKISDDFAGNVTINDGLRKKELHVYGGKNIKSLTISNFDGNINIYSEMPKVKELYVYLGYVTGIDFSKFPNVERISTGSCGWIKNDGKNMKLQGLKKLKEVIFWPDGSKLSLKVYDCPKIKNITVHSGVNSVKINNCGSLKEVCVVGNAKVSFKNCKKCKVVRTQG